MESTVEYIISELNTFSIKYLYLQVFLKIRRSIVVLIKKFLYRTLYKREFDYLLNGKIFNEVIRNGQNKLASELTRLSKMAQCPRRG